MMKRIWLLNIIFLMNFSLCAEKKAVLIIGMPRSGSSCLTGVLQLMGLYLSGPLRPPNQYNKKGFFELTPLMKLNNKILKRCGTHYYDTQPFYVKDISSDLWSACKQEIKDAVQNYFGDAQLFGLKDCRLTLLLPLWIEALEELGYTPILIGALRDASAITQSVNTFDKIPVKKVSILVEKYYSLIDEYTQGYDYFGIYFSELLQNTLDVLQAVNNFLPELIPFEAKIESIEEFLDKKLKHH